MIMSILGGLIGALGGAVLIGSVLFLVFRLIGFEVPRFAVLWKAAFFAQAAVILVEGIGPLVMPGALGSILILLLGLLGAFTAYDRILETPAGAHMGRKAAALALGTHAVFSLLSFFVLFPILLRAFT